MLINLPTHTTDKGNLTVLQEILPFEIKRIYWIYNSDMKLRGGHRHKITRQALVAVHGEIIINVENREGKYSLLLDNPSKCLIIEPEDWHTMLFKNNSTLLVMASHKYDKNDYIKTSISNK